MDFQSIVLLHHLNVCTVNEIICQHCLRVIVLSAGALPRMIACPGCGRAARAVKRIRVRAATSRMLPRAEILKVRAGGVVQLSRQIEGVFEALPFVDDTRFQAALSRLGLNGNPQQWCKSKQLKIWVERNRHGTYVPEALLEAWKMTVEEADINLAGTSPRRG